MTIKLWVGNKNYSSWSLRPYLVLNASGVTFEDEVIVLDHADTRQKITAINPAGRVPVLDHDGIVVWDSLAICEFLAERYPDAHLWPDDPVARSRARSISAEMHAGFAALRRDMPMDIRSRKPGVGHTPDALADAARVQSIWRTELARSGGPFLFGTRFTIADAMYAPVTTRFTTYGVAVDDTCRAYVDTIAKHPGMVAWREAAEREPWTIDYDRR
jgi:glutathione S-transferase